ncbi:LrgB-like family-domain-containing protein [Geopyxis carbonaria]|nr:LrgB-like family-domain-containing protein [Geopyxis carbonaria]
MSGCGCRRNAGPLPMTTSSSYLTPSCCPAFFHVSPPPPSPSCRPSSNSCYPTKRSSMMRKQLCKSYRPLEPHLGLANFTFQAFSRSAPRLLRAWLYVPFGSLLILLACWGVDAVIRRTGVAFPASVACMLLLFLALLLCERALGARKTRAIVRVIDVPAGFALRYIGVYFTPSFVLLPLNKAMGAAEAAKIVGVFFVGFVVALAATAYFLRGLQFVLGLPKRRQREENEDGAPHEAIPLTLASTPASSAASLIAPEAAAEAPRVRGAGPVCTSISVSRTTTRASVTSLPPLQRQRIFPSRAQLWGELLVVYTDVTIYTTLLLLVGLPVLYTTGYATPAHLCLTVLSYRAALTLPPRIRSVLHPVLGSSALMIGALALLSVSRRQPLAAALHAYSTGASYLSILNSSAPAPAPGAADILRAALDISIVALALPTFQHRASLPPIPLLAPTLLSAGASLVIYPVICNAIALPAGAGKAFAVRSLTLALATPAVTALGGDKSLTAILCISSGVLGALVGERVLRLCGVGPEEWVVRGVAMGVNASAVGTASLLERGEVRAAAVSTVAMVVMGVAVVAVCSVGAVSEGVGALAGG